MQTILGQHLTREVNLPGVDPAMTTTMLNELYPDANYATGKTSELWGTKPRYVRQLYYDEALHRDPTTLAYNMDPQDIKSVDRELGEKLERQLGPDPIIALNPKLVYHDREFRRRVVHHEGGHSSQPAKALIKSIYAITEHGALPLGTMFLEGSNEWALEQMKMKAPSEYMKKHGNREPTYSVFKNFVYDLEDTQKGITRLVYRAASRGGPDAVIKLLESNPYVGRVVEKYALKLHNMKTMN